MRPHRGEVNELGEEKLIYTNADSGAPSNTGMCIWRATSKGLLRISYPDGTQFWLDNRRETLWALWPETLSLEETCTYLLGPIFGLLLRLRGTICLHASAVNIGGRGVAFVGSAGAGKSTTAAAFAQQGFPVLSDDIVPVVERNHSFLVLPAYSYLSLWPDSVNMLFGSPNALQRFTPNWEKRCLILGERGTRFENQPLPLAAIYILDRCSTDSGPRVEPVRPHPALLSLLTDSYATRILDRELRAQEFELLGRLAAAIPVRRVFAHGDTAHLGDLCRMIEADFASLKDWKRPLS